MIGLVIVTHGALGREFRSALEHVMGPQEQFESVCVEDEIEREVLLQNIRGAIKRVDSGEGVVLLTDIFGGTPSNLAIAALNGSPIELISGVNLPMLITLAKVRCKAGLAEAVNEAKSSGRRYIHAASDVLCRFPRINQRSDH